MWTMMEVPIHLWAFPGNIVKKMVVLSLLLDECEISSFWGSNPEYHCSFPGMIRKKEIVFFKVG